MGPAPAFVRRVPGLGQVGQVTAGPLYVCPDGSQVMASSDCPAGAAPSDQGPAPFFTGYGPPAVGQTRVVPFSSPIPAIPQGSTWIWWVLGLVVAAAFFSGGRR